MGTGVVQVFCLLLWGQLCPVGIDLEVLLLSLIIVSDFRLSKGWRFDFGPLCLLPLLALDSSRSLWSCSLGHGVFGTNVVAVQGDALLLAALEDVGATLVLALHFFHVEENLLDEVHAFLILVLVHGNHRNRLRTSKVFPQ